MWIIIEKLIRRYSYLLPWQFKYLFGKAGVGGMDISIDRHFEYAFIIARLKSRERGLLVDIGSAGSLLSPSLAALGYEVVGYDLHPWSLKYPHYEHRIGDACKMHFEDATVDYCVSVSCIEHLGNSRYSSIGGRLDEILMKEIYRILKPGGTLLMSVPYGVKKELASHRVYDEESIKSITSGFCECYREIYVPVADRSLFHYRMGSAEEAIAKRPWYRYSVISLELQKPRYA
jgi:SAM-dependent methyltransferase